MWIRLEMKNCKMILTKKLEKYLNYHLEKLMTMNNSQLKKYYCLFKVKLIEQARFTYFTLVKPLKIKTKKQVNASKFLNLCNKIDQLKQIEIIFHQNL